MQLINIAQRVQLMNKQADSGQGAMDGHPESGFCYEWQAIIPREILTGKNQGCSSYCFVAEVKYAHERDLRKDKFTCAHKMWV